MTDLQILFNGLIVHPWIKFTGLSGVAWCCVIWAFFYPRDAYFVRVGAFFGILALPIGIIANALSDGRMGPAYALMSIATGFACFIASPFVGERPDLQAHPFQITANRDTRSVVRRYLFLMCIVVTFILFAETLLHFHDHRP